MGRFKAPTLRNIAVTAPYMHDGSIATLSEVLDHYAAGGRTISDGPNAGVGSANPLKSERLTGFALGADAARRSASRSSRASPTTISWAIRNFRIPGRSD